MDLLNPTKLNCRLSAHQRLYGLLLFGAVQCEKPTNSLPDSCHPLLLFGINTKASGGWLRLCCCPGLVILIKLRVSFRTPEAQLFSHAGRVPPTIRPLDPDHSSFPELSNNTKKFSLGHLQLVNTPCPHPSSNQTRGSG